MFYKCNFVGSIQFDKKYEKLNWSDFTFTLVHVSMILPVGKAKFITVVFTRVNQSVTFLELSINYQSMTLDISRNIYPLCTL